LIRRKHSVYIRHLPLKGKKLEGFYGKKNGVKIITVLEAKITLFNGISIPLATEFVRNSDTVIDEFRKQNCELNAAYRLIPKLKKKYPKLKRCLLLDSLYPCKDIIKSCFDEGGGG